MSEQITAPVSHHLNAASDDGEMRRTALIALATVAAILVIYYQTTSAMVSIWHRSDTFAHCFLIAPISAWIIWRERRELKRVTLRPNPWALIVLVGLGFGWLLAALANVLVFQQYFVVAMIPIAVWSILGTRMAWAIAFPLAYLLLAVPFGEVFLPTLIDFTADFTVTALQLTGIPVYREGTFFTLPTGNWSVVEACSGLRYLIASFTLGSLYAYLSYKSLKRRLAFTLISLIVPIIANGIRAYIIVMLGHLSDMRIATGADHLVYGWVFFGFVMLLLFWIGSFWREDLQAKDEAAVNTETGTAHTASLTKTASIGIATIAIALLWPAYAGYLNRDIDLAPSGRIDIPGIPGTWEVSHDQNPKWTPAYVGTPAQYLRTYQSGSRSVSVYITEYRNQRPGSQLITTGNALVGGHDHDWNNVSEQTRRIDLGSQQFTITQNQLHSRSKKLLIWRWYRLGPEETISPYVAKVILAKHKLLGRGDDGAEIIVAATYEDRPDEAVPVLQGFLKEMIPAIRKGLAHVSSH